jgi:hypothetical protein
MHCVLTKYQLIKPLGKAKLESYGLALLDLTRKTTFQLSEFQIIDLYKGETLIAFIRSQRTSDSEKRRKVQ